MKHSCEKQASKNSSVPFPITPQKLAFVAENEGCFKSPNSCPRLLGSVMVVHTTQSHILLIFFFKSPEKSKTIEELSNNYWAMLSYAESILQIVEKMFCILYVQFTTWFFSFSHRSVTTKTIARLGLHSKPMSNNMFCIGCTLWIVFGFLLSASKENEGLLYMLSCFGALAFSAAI